MITLELAGEFLTDKGTQIFSSGSWIKDYGVKSIYIRTDEFGYDEFVFICQYWDCGLIQTTKCSSMVERFNWWLEDRRNKRIGQLV